MGAGDVRIETVPDAHLLEPTDALVTVSRSAICGSDLWPYKTMEQSETGRRMGHEFIGVIEGIGDQVQTLKPGDVVVNGFLYSDGTCVFCQEGLQTACLHGGRFGFEGVDGGRARRFVSPGQTGRSSPSPWLSVGGEHVGTSGRRHGRNHGQRTVRALIGPFSNPSVQEDIERLRELIFERTSRLARSFVGGLVQAYRHGSVPRVGAQLGHVFGSAVDVAHSGRPAGR
jgi:hypothetical protein